MYDIYVTHDMLEVTSFNAQSNTSISCGCVKYVDVICGGKNGSDERNITRPRDNGIFKIISTYIYQHVHVYWCVCLMSSCLLWMSCAAFVRK